MIFFFINYTYPNARWLSLRNGVIIFDTYTKPKTKNWENDLGYFTLILIDWEKMANRQEGTHNKD